MSDDSTPPDDESIDDNTPDPENELPTEDPDLDSLEAGIIPPDRWSPAQGFGNTPAEVLRGETLDQRLAEEEPDTPPTQVSDRWPQGPQPRSGRLVAEDEGAHPDTESEAVARDVGVDGGAAGAEEAAVHIVPEEEVP